MKKTFFALAALTVQGCSSHTYHSEAMKLAEVAHEVLIKEGVCKSIEQCRKEERVFIESGGWSIGPFSNVGAYLNVYGINSASVAEQLAASVGRIHTSMPGVPVHLSVFSSPHRQAKVLLKRQSFK